MWFFRTYAGTATRFVCMESSTSTGTFSASPTMHPVRHPNRLFHPLFKTWLSYQFHCEFHDDETEHGVRTSRHMAHSDD